jgi:peptidyl-prolyl cis-trans isomerase C/peptidyl-prolyl cis-trans isomerase SurA
MATLAGSSGLTATIDVNNGIAAIVNTAVVTRQELSKYTAQAVDLLMRTYGNRPELFQQRLEEAMRDGLEQLIERQLILHEFDTSGAILPESVIDERIKEIIRDKYTDRLTLTKTLQAEGITTDQFRQQARENIIISYMRTWRCR